MTVLRRWLAGCSTLAFAGLTLVGAAPPGGAQTPLEPVLFGFTGESQTYEVPSDGSVCAITVDAAGANGGTALAIGGSGGQVVATLPVAPGEVVTIDVGGVGTSVSSGATGGSGGFGGGAPGGDSVGGLAIGAAGGGGATTIGGSSGVLLVAGGGGGAGPGGGEGGNGGSAGGAGTDGELGAGLSGGGGGGGTPTAGGSGGASGGTDAEAGDPGTAGTGGEGGTAATSIGQWNGGGGGGGGGFFGGGGGGGGTNNPLGGSGGGGGGGSGFVVASATDVGGGSLTPDEGGNGQAEITPLSGTCPNTLTVLKVVQGDVPAGTGFSVHVECIHQVGDEEPVTTVDDDLFFDAGGVPTNGTTPAVEVLPDSSCTVTETVNGGAATVAYACVASGDSSDSVECQPGNRDVMFTGPIGLQSATVTVTNTFPTSPVVIAPAFTG
jgi:hypothetical protein